MPHPQQNQPRRKPRWWHALVALAVVVGCGSSCRHTYTIDAVEFMEPAGDVQYVSMVAVIANPERYAGKWIKKVE